MQRRLVLYTIGAFAATVAAVGPPALAWNAHGHRTITYLALDGLPPEAPAWLRDPSVRHRIAYQSNEPDRYRGWPALPLKHDNEPDHYVDVELLAQFGLTLETLPKLRREYLRALAVSKHLHPEMVDPYDASDDPARTKEWPGFLPHAITEQYAALQASFNTVRILEQLNDPARGHQLEQARANAIYHMGMLSHFVGDAAQPLHTTKHHHGWVGDNPAGYTTDRGFHSKIDGRVLEMHSLTFATLRPQVRFDRAVNAAGPWDDTLAHIRRSFEQVEPLYRLERDEQMGGEASKTLITERLSDAAAMLSALYWAAYTSAAPTSEQVSNWVRYNDFKPELLPDFPTPASAPATTAPTASAPLGAP